MTITASRRVRPAPIVTSVHRFVVLVTNLGYGRVIDNILGVTELGDLLVIVVKDGSFDFQQRCGKSHPVGLSWVVLPMNMKQKFCQPNDAELEWIANSIVNACTLVTASRPEDVECKMTPEILDVAYKNWLNGDTKLDMPANDVIHAIGFAFGQFLVDHDGFEWTIVSDQFGTDLGVRALPDRGDVLIYPANMVAKRWETQETDFLVPIYQGVIDQRNKIRDSWDSQRKSPWWKPW